MSAQREQYILAIDLGTSGPKVALVSLRGEICACEREHTGLTLLPDGGAEQIPDEWWQAITAAARRVLARAGVPAEAVVALNCASQYSCTLAVGRDGRPLMNAINWMDTRGAQYVRQITGGAVEFQGYGLDKLLTWLRLTGGIPTHSGKDAIAHILYLKHERPEIYRAAYKFLEPKDYINLRFTGQFAATYDSMNLHWLTDNRDIAHIDYSDRLIALAGVDRAQLPDLKRAVDVLGPLCAEAAAALGLSERTLVMAGCTDAQSAAVGSGAVRDYEAHLYLGTSSWVSCHVPFKKTDLFHNMASLPSAMPGRYYIANEQECAGACLDFLRDNLLYPADALANGPRPDDYYQRVNSAAGCAAPGSGGLIFTPWLVGERTPIEDPTVRGGFFNASLRTTREQLARAVFEGVAFNTRWLFGYVEQFAGRRLDPVNAIGGGAQSDLWCQIHADVLDRTIRQVSDPIWAGTRGVALLAAAGLGHFTFDEIPEHVHIARTFEPDPANRRIYDELFREFVNVYNHNRAAYARLNRNHG